MIYKNIDELIENQKKCNNLDGKSFLHLTKESHLNEQILNSKFEYHEKLIFYYEQMNSNENRHIDLHLRSVWIDSNTRKIIPEPEWYDQMVRNMGSDNE